MGSGHSFHEEASKFVRTLHSQVKSLGIDTTDCSIDHICYRVENQKQYDHWKSFLSERGLLLSEALINGRPIATYKLKEPISYSESHVVPLIELPSPKDGVSYTEGFEHIEYVIPTCFDQFMEQNPILKQHGKLSWRCFNPELRFPMGKYSVKFHYSSLEDVIALEKLPPEKQKICVLDFDGTIVDSMPHIKEINRLALKTLGVPESKLNRWKTFPSTYEEVIDFAELPRSRLNDFVKLWSEDIQRRNPPAFPEAVELLKQKAEERIPLVIWTARDLTSTVRWLREHEMEHFFKKIWAFDSKPSKPDLSGLKYITGARPGELIEYFGDSSADQIAAQAIGAQFYWAKWNPAVFH